MVTIVQFAFGALLVVLAVGLLAVPGLVVGGIVGLLLRRFARPSPRATRTVVIVWVVVCLLATVFGSMQVETQPRTDPLDPLVEGFLVLLGLASAAGGGYGLRRCASPLAP